MCYLERVLAEPGRLPTAEPGLLDLKQMLMCSSTSHLAEPMLRVAADFAEGARDEALETEAILKIVSSFIASDPPKRLTPAVLSDNICFGVTMAIAMPGGL